MDDDQCLPRAAGVSRDAEGAWGTVTLACDARHRRRGVMRTDAGAAFLLDLPQAVELREGDALVLEDGRRVLVRAAVEPLTEVRAADPLHLARLAWHLGNRHLQAQIEDGRLLIRRDHVIEAMLEGLGARLAAAEAPFHPEGGAYAHGHAHGAGRDG
jgi:urease accessory protein